MIYKAVFSRNIVSINAMKIKSIVYFLIFLFLSPVLFILSIIVFLTMGRPIIFQQERIGLNRKPFTIYKFRTMNKGCVTTFGQILRSTGLDEFPQIINLIKHEMAFVGPRPLTAFDIDRLGWNAPYYNKRWEVHPGISGFSQLAMRCHPKITICYDFYYAKNKSYCLDAKIILWSLVVPFLGKKIVQQIIHRRRKRSILS